MADLLSLLREYVSAGQEVRLDGDEVLLGERRFPADAPTAWKNSKAGVYSLRAVVYWLLSSNQQQVSTYIRDAKGAGVDILTFRDRKLLVPYLKGEKDAADVAQHLDADAAALPAAAGPAAAGPAAGVKRKREEVTLADVLASERTLTSYERVLHSDRKSFEDIYEQQRELARESREGHKRARAEKKRARAAARRGPPQVPVLVVPGGLSSLVNMINAKGFLEDGVLVPSAEKLRGGAKKGEKKLVISVPNLQRPGERAKFEVIDDPVRLLGKNEDQWDRVVAVLLSGKKWQFDKWIWGAPAKIFLRVPGIYISYDDANSPPAVREWAVGRLDVSRTKPQLAKIARQELWRRVFASISARRQDAVPLDL